MKNLIKVLAIMVATGIVACDTINDGPDMQPKPIELTTKSGEVINAGNTFGVDLFVKTALDEPKNLMLSPLSATIALTMALNGAKGETYNQMRDMLGYAAGADLSEINNACKSLVNQLLSADKKVTLALANAMFYSNDFMVRPNYVNVLKTDFNAQVQALDFRLPSALQAINQWAASNTNQKVTKVLEEIESQMVMFLLNALYFKGNWTRQFDKSKTTSMPFTLDSGQQKNIPTMISEVGVMMHQTPDYMAVELPYGRKNFSMVVVVPSQTLNVFYKSFGPEMWHQITRGLDSQTTWSNLHVYLPKFKFEYEKELNDVLIKMGMADAFSEQYANFSAISDEFIWIDFVKQNTFVNVNEEGTEAAAVTTIAFTRDSLPPSALINKPFVFAIRERTTNTLMFIGQVVDPAL